MFSASGWPSGGYDCVRIYEPDDLKDGWGNNYYCWRNDRVDPGLYWTHTSNTYVTLLFIVVFDSDFLTFEIICRISIYTVPGHDEAIFQFQIRTQVGFATVFLVFLQRNPTNIY